jgi:hypothetical protein
MSDIGVACRVALGIVFLISSVRKIVSPIDFFTAIARHEVLPARWSPLVGKLIIVAETCAAAAMISGYFGILGILLSAILLAVFAVIMLRNLGRPQPVPCHCFGSNDDDEDPRQPLYRILLLVLALGVVVAGLGLGRDDGTSAPSLTELLLGTGLLVLGTWMLRARDLIQLHQMPIPVRTTQTRRVSLHTAPMEPIRITRES